MSRCDMVADLDGEKRKGTPPPTPLPRFFPSLSSRFVLGGGGGGGVKLDS